MRLLVLGSLLVVLSIAGWGALQWAVLLAPEGPAPADLPVFRFVGFERARSGAPSGAVVWQTSTGREDCTDLVDRRRRDEGRRLAALMSSAGDSAGYEEDPEACTPFQLGEVERGVKVEVVGECGRMARVLILSGSLEGRQGCIETDRLSAGVSGSGSRS